MLEHIPVEMFDTAQHIASRGPFLVAKEVLPAMRAKGAGSFFFSNNASSLRGRKRMTGQSLYYPRVMMRTLAQVLTEEYSEYGVHVANVVIDGTINSPGTRTLPRVQNRPELVINPVKIAEAFYYLHTQDRSCWTQQTPAHAIRDETELLMARVGLVSSHARTVSSARRLNPWAETGSWPRGMCRGRKQPVTSRTPQIEDRTMA